MKSIFIIILLTITMLGEISFKETKSFSAIDLDMVKYGTLNIQKDKLIINYLKPNQETIRYLNDKIEILNKEDIKSYSFKEHPNAQYMGLILRSIIKKEYTLLNELFEIEKEKNIVTLTAKPIIYNYINSIEVTNDKRDIIIIYMSNQDKITIETIN